MIALSKDLPRLGLLVICFVFHLVATLPKHLGHTEGYFATNGRSVDYGSF
jgi:hypothetical protein